MESLAGVTLSELLARRGALPVDSAAEYVRQACVGMQHAHERGLVHRDLKPGNLMLCDGVVKILDLGLALVPTAERMTRLGQALGTVDYVAPEQVAAPGKVDIRADVYSLGCTLYQLLAGVTPFHETHPAARPTMHASQEPTSVEARRADVPADVAAVVRKMMAKRREDRYQTPGEAAEALAALSVAKKGPPPLPTAAVTQRLPAPTPRRRLRSPLIAGAALVFVLGVIGALVARTLVRKDDTSRPPVPLQKAESNPSKGESKPKRKRLAQLPGQPWPTGRELSGKTNNTGVGAIAVREIELSQDDDKVVRVLGDSKAWGGAMVWEIPDSVSSPAIWRVGANVRVLVGVEPKDGRTHVIMRVLR